MKFKDSYNRQLDDIKPDGYIKDKPRRRIVEQQVIPAPQRSGRAFFGTAVAAALCGAILFSAGIVTGRRTAKVNTSDNTAAMKTAPSYGDIYEKIKEFKNKEYIVGEYAYDDAMNTGADTGPKPTNTKRNSASNTDTA